MVYVGSLCVTACMEARGVSCSLSKIKVVGSADVCAGDPAGVFGKSSIDLYDLYQWRQPSGPVCVWFELSLSPVGQIVPGHYPPAPGSWVLRF